MMTVRQISSKAMRPRPVYEAHFSDGTVSRLSFWTERGKPFDLDRARNLFGPGVPLVLRDRIDFPAFHGKEVVAGFVEHDVPGKPWLRFADPHFTGEPAPVPIRRKAKPGIKQARTVIGQLLAAIETGEFQPETLQQARELIAA